MLEGLTELAMRLVACHRGGFRLALLFDYDGTLTPIADHPDLARVADDTLGLLGRLARRPGVGVGIISGRGLDNLRSVVGLCGIHYAGTSGLELDLQGSLVMHPEAERYRAQLTTMYHRLDVLAKRYAGAWVEDKPLGLTLHYRHVAPEGRRELHETASEVVAAARPRLRLVDGPLALEITPHLDWDKGSAVRQIVDAVGRPVIPVYAGDATDEQALAATAQLGGVTLAVGGAACGDVDHQLDDSSALVGFLRGLETAFNRCGRQAKAARAGSYASLRPTPVGAAR